MITSDVAFLGPTLRSSVVGTKAEKVKDQTLSNDVVWRRVVSLQNVHCEGLMVSHCLGPSASHLELP